MNRTAPIAVAAALAALAGCDVARPIADAGSGVAACTGCHGDAARAEDVALVNAAPPVTATGGADGGAHLAHLHAGPLAGAIACDACHEVPRSADHSDGVVSVTFPALARPNGLVPTWNPATGTCSGVSCHGAGMAGGATASPPWSSTAALGCASCHPNPPASHAGRSSDCSTCHPGTVKPDGTIWVENGLHVNGQVDAAGAHAADWGLPSQHGYTVNRTGLASCKTCHGTALGGGTGPACASCHDRTVPGWDTSCTFCHGDRSTGRASPPLDTQGRSATSNVSVGVHAAHVGTTIAAPIACGQCHPARSASVITDAAHVDGDGVAEVEFGTGTLARTGGASPTYARGSATSSTCASTYCHGRFTGGANSGAGATVNWTSTTQVSCSSCHPSSPTTGEHQRHTSRYGCGSCHPSYTSTTANAAIHLNGTKNVTLSSGTWSASARTCSNVSCHGSTPNSETW